MDNNQLQDLVTRYQQNREFITNEESTKMALIVPFIRHLGYDPQNPREVRLEYRAEFYQGDGSKHRDRMDYAIFDVTGANILMVIEAKPLGSNIEENSPQLAYYLNQVPGLHFGILTDGCRYRFFGDLENPNVMDKRPFFEFSLKNPKTDWVRVGQFLSKFSRENFNAETLVTDAENSRYRQAMTEKITIALRNPASDEGFIKWLAFNVYKGNLTTSVKDRLAKLAKEAIEPALVNVLEDDFLDRLKQRFQQVREAESETEEIKEVRAESSLKTAVPTLETNSSPSGIVTTEEELEFYLAIKDICVSIGINPDAIISRDTTNYFNVSYLKPTKWFIRFLGNAKRKSIVSPVSIDEAKQLAPTFEVDQPSPSLGGSRIYIDNIVQIRALKDFVIRSLEFSRGQGE